MKSKIHLRISDVPYDRRSVQSLCSKPGEIKIKRQRHTPEQFMERQTNQMVEHTDVG